METFYLLVPRLENSDRTLLIRDKILRNTTVHSQDHKYISMWHAVLSLRQVDLQAD